MPSTFIKAFGTIKKCAARVNIELGLKTLIAKGIMKAADEVSKGRWKAHFPVKIYQSGSGMQTNMNVNEVIANRAEEILGLPISPYTHVNKNQSSSDCFSIAMHLSTLMKLDNALIPALKILSEGLMGKMKEFESIIKASKTHLQESFPITLGQEFESYAIQIDSNIARLCETKSKLLEIAHLGTSIGSSKELSNKFTKAFTDELSKETGYPFKPSKSALVAVACHDIFVEISGSLNTLAVSLMKIADDIRFLGSGPRCGFGELLLPGNEPGSSIMPGKVNPTQCESITMICEQVMGNTISVTLGGSRGNFEMNAFKPLIIGNVLHSIRLLADGINSFTAYCLLGITANKQQIKKQLEDSLSLVAILVPSIGYEKALKVEELAKKRGMTIKEAASILGCIKPEAFDSLFIAENYVKTG
jgi:fumarate hydratase class II